MRRVLGFRRLSRAALQTVRRIVDIDDEFRERALRTADEQELGRPAWVWLARGDGWERELAELAEAAQEVVAEPVEHAGQLRRRLAGAEENARRCEAEAASAREREQRARAELREERRARRQAERARDALAAELSTGHEDRISVAAALDAAERDVDRLRSELDVARAALHEAEADLLSARAPGPAKGGPQVAPADVDATERLVAAADAAAELSRTLAEAVEAAGATNPLGTAGPARSGEARGRSRPTAPDRRPDVPAHGGGRVSHEPRRPGRPERRPAAMPPAIWGDAPEAAAHLVRLPGAAVLVDGYNVARTAWSGLTPEEERTRLVPALEELHARTGAQVVVVFDGQQGGAAVSRRPSRTVRVQFSPAGTTADDVVLDLVGTFPVERPVIVVSSDREVADGARSRGANSVSSRQFLTVLGR